MRENEFLDMVFDALKLMQVRNFDYGKTHTILLDVSNQTIKSIEQLNEKQNQKSSDKYVIIFAGPNASGKSTMASKVLQKKDLPFLNPDMVAKLLFNHIKDEEEKYSKHAMPYTEELRNRLIESEVSFSIETVFSDSRKLVMVSDLKKEGYRIFVVWIGTENPIINAERAMKRQEEGGHFVPRDKVHARYYKSMDNLSKLVEISDSAIVLDNSIEPYVVIRKSNGCYHLEEEKKCPAWINVYLMDRL